jgi:hypothetical protein
VSDDESEDTGDGFDEDDTPPSGRVRPFTDTEMRRFEAVSLQRPHPRHLLDAVWDVILRDVKGISLRDARRDDIVVSPNDFAIPLDQWQTLFGLVRSTGTGNIEEDLDLDDIWIAEAPNTYP